MKTLGPVLSETFTELRTAFWPIFMLGTVLFAIPSMLIYAVNALVFAPRLGTALDAQKAILDELTKREDFSFAMLAPIWQELKPVVIPFLQANAIFMILSAALGALLTVSILSYLRAKEEGTELSFEQSVAKGIRSFWRAICVSVTRWAAFVACLLPAVLGIVLLIRGAIVAGALILLFGLIAGLIVGTFLSLRWAFAYCAVVWEDRDAIPALRRSWSLVDGKEWRVFGWLIVAGLIVVGAGIVVGFFSAMLVYPLSLLAPTFSGFLDQAISGLWQAATMAFSSIFLVRAFLAFTQPEADAKAPTTASPGSDAGIAAVQETPVAKKKNAPARTAKQTKKQQ